MHVLKIYKFPTRALFQLLEKKLPHDLMITAQKSVNLHVSSPATMTNEQTSLERLICKDFTFNICNTL